MDSLGYLHAVNSSGILCKHILWRTPWVRVHCFPLPNICAFANHEHDHFPYTTLLCLTTIKKHTHGENKLKCLPSIQHYYTMIGKPWAFLRAIRRVLLPLEDRPFGLIYSLINIASVRHMSTFCLYCNHFSPKHSKNQLCHLWPHWGGFFHLGAHSAYLRASSLKGEVWGMLTWSTFVNRNLLLVNEGSLIPWKYGFNFSLKLQSNKLPAHIFLCQMFPLW